ncbi:MAG: hypothetical protein FJ267_05510, partial [Planctomycetes bacterium]|nr:hypothetical protein [Planctomycetota bacterium]
MGVLPVTEDHMKSTHRIPWLFSPTVDLLAFLGSAGLALGIVAVAFFGGWLEQETPEWLWVTSILMVDVAHVYATGFRVYFDRREISRRPWLYFLVPVLAYVLGLALYSESPSLFWRVLAYVAVFHFVRQQYGWVALYRAKERSEIPSVNFETDRNVGAGSSSGRGGGQQTQHKVLPPTSPGRVLNSISMKRLDAWIDTAAIYLATIYPLVYWHTHSRRFHWFVVGDFIEIPSLFETVLAPFYWASLIVYAVRSLYRGAIEGKWNPGKDLVVTTTAICWYLGIVALDSDVAFTVTNVLTHGIPYGILIAWDALKRKGTELTGV